MGEAKRRKQLDPNFGSKYKNADKWFDQMMKTLPSNYLPDAGHIYLKSGIIGKETISYFNGHVGTIMPDKTGYCQLAISTSVNIYTFLIKTNYPVNGILNPVQLLDVFIRWELMPNARYLTQDGQWIIPFKGEFLKGTMRYNEKSISPLLRTKKKKGFQK